MFIILKLSKSKHNFKGQCLIYAKENVILEQKKIIIINYNIKDICFIEKG